jgi:HD-GYP domain-containing protein (c-di-GMP phosphodiesterase class II)
MIMSSLSLYATPAELAVEETFRRLAATTDVFERYAHPHASRIADLTDALAASFKLPVHDRRALRIAALAHDLGEAKMERDYIQLQLPSHLSVDERLDLARHPVIGEQEAARNGADKAAQLLVRWHHEWWNGEGYPDGLRGEQIPLAARILRVCDSFAALTDDRPYRPSLTLAQVRQHLTEWAGLEFDPHVVQVFFTLDDPKLIRSYADIAPAALPDSVIDHGPLNGQSVETHLLPPDSVQPLPVDVPTDTADPEPVAHNMFSDN